LRAHKISKKQEILNNIKEQNQFPMPINEKSLIQKNGELTMETKNKDEKLVIKTVRFYDV
jgi:hypothetical protein